MSISAYDILGIANPFWDRSLLIADEFLIVNSLDKGQGSFTENRDLVDATWAKANSAATTTLGSIGGSGANVINVLGHLGNRCALLGKIGSKDLISRKIEDHLVQLGVTSLLTRGTKPTGIVNCFITPDKQRTMQAYLGSASEFTGQEIVEEYFRRVKHVHIEGYAIYFGGSLETSIGYASKYHATTSIDLGNPNLVQGFRSRFEESIPKVSYVFGNSEEMRALMGTESAQEAVEHFDKHQTAVATCGSGGCWVKAAGESDAVSFRAPEVPLVMDTTGAGDCFAGGFLHLALKNRNASECVQAANLAAGYVIQEVGANLSEARWAQLSTEISRISNAT